MPDLGRERLDGGADGRAGVQDFGVAVAGIGAGRAVEVIDLRSLLPYDKAALFTSIQKTSRLLIVHEDVKTLGIGSELAAVAAKIPLRT